MTPQWHAQRVTGTQHVTKQRIILTFALICAHLGVRTCAGQHDQEWSTVNELDWMDGQGGFDCWLVRTEAWSAAITKVKMIH